MELRAKSLKAAPSLMDGERVLVSRLRPKDPLTPRCDAWERDLAPSVKLDFALWRGWITPREHAALYVGEMWGQAGRLRKIGERAAVRPVTLVCTCSDRHGCRCHLLIALVNRLFTPRRELAAAR